MVYYFLLFIIIHYLFKCFGFNLFMPFLCLIAGFGDTENNDKQQTSVTKLKQHALPSYYVKVLKVA